MLLARKVGARWHAAVSCYLWEPLSVLGSDQHLHNLVVWPLVMGPLALLLSSPQPAEVALDLQILYGFIIFGMQGAMMSVPLDSKALSPKSFSEVSLLPGVIQ